MLVRPKSNWRPPAWQADAPPTEPIGELCQLNLTRLLVVLADRQTIFLNAAIFATFRVEFEFFVVCTPTWKNLISQPNAHVPSWILHPPFPVSSPESACPLVSTKNTDSWPLSRHELRKSRTSGSSTHAQKLETTVVVNGYNKGPSLRLRISWKWPELGQSPCSWCRPKEKRARGTRLPPFPTRPPILKVVKITLRPIQNQIWAGS